MAQLPLALIIKTNFPHLQSQKEMVEKQTLFAAQRHLFDPHYFPFFRITVRSCTHTYQLFPLVQDKTQ